MYDSTVKRIILLAVFLVPLTAHAWTLAADRHIASEGAKLAPPDLLYVIKKFNKEYARGIEKAERSEPQDEHTAELRKHIEEKTKTIIAMLKANQPMHATVEQLGVLAHLIGDANNPFHVAGANPTAHADFERYFEMRMRKFPLVDYGREPNLRLEPYVDGMLARTAKLTARVDEEYGRGNSQTFDDHSTAFGVASISYSHAVTDIANLFAYIWKQSGGIISNANH
jgi:hypothetical protein